MKIDTLNLFLKHITTLQSDVVMFKGIVDRYSFLHSIDKTNFDPQKMKSNIMNQYYQDLYQVLAENSFSILLENGITLFQIYYLFKRENNIDFSLTILKKTKDEIDEFGDWLHHQNTLDTKIWADTHEVYRMLNSIRFAIKAKIEELDIAKK